MTQVFLTSASTSPWSKPGDWTDPGHTVELVGCGGNGGTITATATVSGGGGGGAYLKATYSSGSLGATTTFKISASNSSLTDADTAGTFWQGNSTTNTHEAKAGLAGPVSGSSQAGGTGGTGVTNGTPSPVTYTTSTNAGGTGGTHGAQPDGGSGGGGAGGPSGGGGAGGASTGAGGGGGGGSNGGATGGADVGNSGGAGGNGFGGSGGGAGATTTGAPNGVDGTANSGGGGGGGWGSGNPATSFGGAGSNDQAFDTSHGLGAGGGGGGNGNSNSVVTDTTGGVGGSYGGGGGGMGRQRSTPITGSGGTGGGGLIVVTYTAYSGPQGSALLAGAGGLAVPLGIVTSVASSPFTGAAALSAIVLDYNPAGNIFTQNLIGTSFGWQGLTLRQRFEPGVLDAVPAGSLTVRFQFAASSNGSMDAAYIGHAAASGDPYDFDGNQMELKFSGANNVSITGAQTINSDQLSGFTYDPTRPLIVSAQFSGTLINLMGFGG